MLKLRRNCGYAWLGGRSWENVVAVARDRLPSMCERGPRLFSSSLTLFTNTLCSCGDICFCTMLMTKSINNYICNNWQFHSVNRRLFLTYCYLTYVCVHSWQEYVKCCWSPFFFNLHIFPSLPSSTLICLFCFRSFFDICLFLDFLLLF